MTVYEEIDGRYFYSKALAQSPTNKRLEEAIDQLKQVIYLIKNNRFNDFEKARIQKLQEFSLGFIA